MEKARLFASYLFSVSLLCMAGAIVYFSFAVMKTIEEVPELMLQVEKTSVSLQPVVVEFNKLNDSIPLVVNQVGLVREQIPAIIIESKGYRELLPSIMEESQAYRQLVPTLLDESKSYRALVPDVLSEVKSTREIVPDVLAEVEATRALVPDILSEVEATRAMIPVTMDRASILIAEARTAGQEASEGAVTGLFTGIIKAPLKLISNSQKAVFGFNKNLNEEDMQLLTDHAEAVLNSGEVGFSRSWKNKKTGAEGTATLVEKLVLNGQSCRKISITTKVKKQETEKDVTTCLDESGSWVPVH